MAFLDASGAGSALNLGRLQSLDFGNTAINTNPYRVNASTGGLVDLSGLTTLNRTDNESMSFNASGAGSRIDLGVLTTLNGGGVTFSASSGGQIGFNALTLPTGNSMNASNASVFEIQNDFAYAGGNLTVSADSSFHVGGSFLNTATDENPFNLTGSTVTVGSGVILRGIQTLEVAAEDVGVMSDASFNNGNFGLGRLVVGDGVSPTLLVLTDFTDNGNRGVLGSEALYLFGPSGQDGLVISAGSILQIGDAINVYTMLEGELTDLRTLFEPGEIAIPFGDGLITIPSVPSILVFGALGLTVAQRRRKA